MIPMTHRAIGSGLKSCRSVFFGPDGLVCFVHIPSVSDCHYHNTDFLVFDAAKKTIIPDVIAPQIRERRSHEGFPCGARIIALGYPFPQEAHNPFLCIRAKLG